MKNDFITHIKLHNSYLHNIYIDHSKSNLKAVVYWCDMYLGSQILDQFQLLTARVPRRNLQVTIATTLSSVTLTETGFHTLKNMSDILNLCRRC